MRSINVDLISSFKTVKTFGLALLLTGVTSVSQAQMTEYTLDNQMKVLIKEDHRAPVVVHQVWYPVGSSYDYNGITGISHMLEHMMFKGTDKYPSGEFSKIVSRMGGKENAFTSTDYTAYYQVVGKQHLEKVMEMEADRMRNALFDEDEFQKERDVVAEERRWRTDDKPIGKLYEQFKAAAFLSSPAHHPVIGWMSDIQNYKVEDVREWYRKWYAPNNAILVVVGDVQPDNVIEMAKKYYGYYKPEKIEPPRPQVEMPQEGERRITLKGATKNPVIYMGFHTPTLVTAKDEATTKEAYALELLASVLGGDSSSRLSKNLVRKQEVMVSVGAGYDASDRVTSLFTFSASPSKGVSTKQAEEAIWQEIEKLQNELVSQEELNRVLAQSEAQYIYHQDSIQAQAMVLGSLVSVGLPADTLDTWVDKIRTVTPEEIQKVAKKYLQRDKLTVATLFPEDEEPSSGQKEGS